jgi:hypothetical protein
MHTDQQYYKDGVLKNDLFAYAPWRSSDFPRPYGLRNRSRIVFPGRKWQAKSYSTVRLGARVLVVVSHT